MSKLSVKAAVRDARQAETKALKATSTADSFVNFAQKLGIGADNALTSGTYGFNPITRNRQLLEWIHRGSWLGGVAVDLIADDMTRAGIDYNCELEPEDSDSVDRAAVSMNIWPTINETIKWGRLYGGCLGVLVIDGQDPKTELRIETVGKGQFKGLVALDRWTVDPSLGDLVTDLGPHLGLPRYYSVLSNSPTMRGQTIHHSRVAFRLIGNELPYQQRLTENLWGASVLERLYDRMIGFDSASTGVAQLVFKAYLRTMKIDGLRDIVAAGGAPLQGLMQWVNLMRMYQGQEGITLIDGNDEFEVQQASSFSGIGDALMQLGQQLSGALQIPLVRLFGQSPAGLNSSGESDISTYYDGIKQRQEKDLLVGTTMTYRCMAQSEGIKVPDDFGISFRSLKQLSAKEKADTANTTAQAVTSAFDAALIGRQTALRELRQSSRATGVFSNISTEMIDAADDEVLPPAAEIAMNQEHELNLAAAKTKPAPGAPGAAKTNGGKDGKPGSQGAARAASDGPRKRVKLQH